MWPMLQKKLVKKKKIKPRDTIFLFIDTTDNLSKFVCTDS